MTCQRLHQSKQTKIYFATDATDCRLAGTCAGSTRRNAATSSKLGSVAESPTSRIISCDACADTTKQASGGTRDVTRHTEKHTSTVSSHVNAHATSSQPRHDHLDLAHSTGDDALDDGAAVVVQQVDLIHNQQPDLRSHGQHGKHVSCRGTPTLHRAMRMACESMWTGAGGGFWQQHLLGVGAVAALAGDDVPLLGRHDDHLQARSR